MTTGRTVQKYARVYVDGYDVSGHTRSMGPLDDVFDEGTDDPLSASIKGVWLGQRSISPGTLNALYDNTATTGMRALFEASSDTEREVLWAQGIQAAPAAGDPCFMSQCRQSSYLLTPESNPTALTVKFSGASGTSTALYGGTPWGILLNANTARTAVNSSTGIDQVVTTSAKGGWMMYHVTTSVGSGNISCTIKVQDSDTNVDGDFDDLLTSGVISTGSSGVAVPCSGVVALAPTATVRQFVRWQIVLGTDANACTSITFVLGFARNLV